MVGILVVGMLILPETPRFLIKQDRYEDATKALARLRRDDLEVGSLSETHFVLMVGLDLSEFSDDDGVVHFKRLATGCAVQGLQQLAGVNFICTFPLIPTTLSNYECCAVVDYGFG
jgi:SP family sugar:H+ symporter-like MFS transporter